MERKTKIDADWFRRLRKDGFNYVNKETFGIYVDLWCKLEENSERMCGVPDKELPHVRLLSFDDGRWLAADNSDGDCWVEEFQCRSNAKAYLNNEAIDLDTLFGYDAAGVAINFKEHYSAMCGEY